MTKSFRTFINFAELELAKIAPWWFARRDSLQAKALGQVDGVPAPPAHTAPTRNRYLLC
jgi:hypothetical protein